MELIDNFPLHRIKIKSLRTAINNLTPILGEASVTAMLCLFNREHALRLDPDSEELIDIKLVRSMLAQSLGDVAADFLVKMIRRELVKL